MVNGLPDVSVEQLDHVIHAMRLSGELARLTPRQVENSGYAFKAAGHTQLRDVSAATYDDGGLISFHTADFMSDPRFTSAYRLGAATNSWLGYDIPWRVYVLCSAGAHALRLRGDFVECGVNRGGFSRAVASYTAFHLHPNRTFYLLDTYCGVPQQDRGMAGAHYREVYTECYSEVCATFRPYPSVRVIRGRVPDTLPQVTSDRVAYLSIDMNCVEPEIATAAYFWDRLVPGAAVILDDYGAGVWHQDQRLAFNRFAKERGVEILSLPTCQGLMIKP